jgi:hypothetical protein
MGKAEGRAFNGFQKRHAGAIQNDDHLSMRKPENSFFSLPCCMFQKVAAWQIGECRMRWAVK